jgi:hypothetical protein
MVGCCSNLGPRQQRLRWWAAIAAVATVLGLLAYSTGPWARVVAVVLVGLAGFCGLQAHRRTCVILAFAGLQDLDHGREPVPDWDTRVVLRGQAWRIVLVSVGLAMITACVAIVT